ncbi:hypothetical protein BJ165DRAFT_1401120 [Panaeolus papilionaceus]|nr:hypothetical protein BJ165DRAFT_1401120 [Panaeolus papilionaceus]
MEEGTKNKKTIFVGGISDDTDESVLYESFSTFGDIIEVQIPPPANQHHHNTSGNELKHRGFAFVTYSSSADAQDAIDNMDLNELKGRVLKVNLARPMKAVIGMSGVGGNRAIWENEEWLKEHVKPLAEAGGVQARFNKDSSSAGPEDKEAVDEEDAMEE